MVVRDNRSTQRTKEAIHHALFSLMKKKPFQSISVAEIIREANISRSTFYNHYKDIFDLVEKIEDELAHTIASKLSTIHYKSYVEGEHPIITAMYGLMEENAEAMLSLLGENGDRHFHDKLSRIMAEYSVETWLQYAGRPEIYPYVTSFMSGGIINLFVESHKGEIVPDAEVLGYIAGEFLAFSATLVENDK